MSDTTFQHVRSPELMSRHDSGLLVVDVQERLLPAIEQNALLAWNIRRLLDGASVLEMQALATEQYTEKLGRTVAPLLERLGDIPSKLSFSCTPCPEVVTFFHLLHHSPTVFQHLFLTLPDELLRWQKP